MAVKPSRRVLHELGVLYSHILEQDCTFQTIGDDLGISKQKAYHECMVALGKFVYGLKKNDKIHLPDVREF